MKLILCFALIISTVSIIGQNKMPQLIPKPVELQASNGKFVFQSNSTIRYNHPEAMNIAEMLARKLSIATGFNLKSQQGTNGAIQFSLNSKQDDELGQEGYTLESISQGVLVTANQPAGLFYGLQTLLQLFPTQIEKGSESNLEWTIPSVKIKDYPRFGWRGIMLDVSRHFFTKEDVKRYIDEISRYKINTFHWHLTDDNGWRIEIKSLPKLTEIGAWRVERFGRFGQRVDPKPGEPATYGGFYTHEDIREIVAYAAERYITIVPEIDVPGHSMAAIAAYPELSCQKNPDTRVNPGTRFAEWYGNGKFKMLIENTLNPSDEKVYEFLDKVLTEVAGLFPGHYIHMGGDECYKGYWEQDPGCQALMKKLDVEDVERLQGYFMNRVEKILKAKGKKLIGWDEILEGGISPEATVMSWRSVKGGIEAAHLGHDVVMSPTTYSYLDYNQGDQTVDPPIYSGLRARKCYSFNPVPDGVDGRYILGGQGNLWTEQVATLRHAEYMTFPRAWALSEVYWSPDESKNWNDFVVRMESHFERADQGKINYSMAVFDAIVQVKRENDKLVVDMDTEIPDLQIYYTVDGSMPDDFSPKYSGPFALPEGPVTMRVVTYKNDNPIGHLITLNPDQLKRRAR